MAINPNPKIVKKRKNLKIVMKKKNLKILLVKTKNLKKKMYKNLKIVKKSKNKNLKILKNLRIRKKQIEDIKNKHVYYKLMILLIGQKMMILSLQFRINLYVHRAGPFQQLALSNQHLL